MSTLEVAVFSLVGAFLAFVILFMYYSFKLASFLRGRISNLLEAVCSPLVALSVLLVVIGMYDLSFKPLLDLAGLIVFLIAVFLIVAGEFNRGRLAQRIAGISMFKAGFMTPYGKYYFIGIVVLVFLGVPASIVNAIILRPDWLIVFVLCVLTFAFANLSIGARKYFLSIKPSVAAITATEEKALLRDDVRVLRTYADMTNSFLAATLPLSGIESLRGALSRCAAEHNILKGCEITNEGVLKTNGVMKTLDEISEGESISELYDAFSTLNSMFIDLYSTIASYDRAAEMILEVMAAEIKLHGEVLGSAGVPLGKHNELLYEYGILMYLPEGMATHDKAKTFAFMLLKDLLEPILRRCKRETIKTIRDRLREIIEKKPMIIGVKIADDGTVDLSNLYRGIEGLPAEESIREVISMSSDVMRICLHIVQKDIVFRLMKEIIENAFRLTLLEKVPSEFELLPTFSEIIKVIPDGMLEKEKLALLSKEELERKVGERTAELETAYRELKAVDRMKDEFLSTTSHELKTPLTSIRSFLQLMNSGELGKITKRQKNAMEIIHKELGRLGGSIDKILEVSRLESGRMKPKMENLQLADIIQDTVKRMRPLAKQKRIILTQKIAELPLIRGDEEQLTEVMTNLIDNAIKFTPEGSRVAIDARKKKENILVEVKDTGIGLARRDMPQLFAKFFQAEHTVPGAGLGLSICKTIVETHGGKIRVESRLGEGSTFFVTLPIKK